MNDATPPPRRAEALAESISDGLGGAVVTALMTAFWQPTMSAPVGLTVMGPNGQPEQIAVPTFNGPSPMTKVVQTVYAQHGDEIVTKVVEQLNLDAFAEHVASKVDTKLTERRERWHYDRERSGAIPSTDEIEKLVREKIADRLTARAVDEYDRRQEAMRAAYEREQAAQTQVGGGQA